MKKLLYIFCILSIGIKAQVNFNTLSDLSLHTAMDKVSVIVNCGTTPGDNGGGIFTWNATSTSAVDAVKTFSVTGVSTGRWIYQSSYQSNQATLSGTTLQTNYIVTHGLGYTPSKIFTQPRSANAAALSYISGISATTFTITYLTVPVLGTNNIVVDWFPIK